MHLKDVALFLLFIDYLFTVQMLFSFPISLPQIPTGLSLGTPMEELELGEGLKDVVLLWYSLIYEGPGQVLSTNIVYSFKNSDT